MHGHEQTRRETRREETDEEFLARLAARRAKRTAQLAAALAKPKVAWLPGMRERALRRVGANGGEQCQ